MTTSKPDDQPIAGPGIKRPDNATLDVFARFCYASHLLSLGSMSGELEFDQLPPERQEHFRNLALEMIEQDIERLSNG